MTAHAYKTVVLHCNRPTCLVSISVRAERITEARRIACTDHGWRYVNLPVPTGGPAVTGDLCPDHVDYELALGDVREAPRKAG